jgi:hypothetical protein
MALWLNEEIEKKSRGTLIDASTWVNFGGCGRVRQGVVRAGAGAE